MSHPFYFNRYPSFALNTPFMKGYFSRSESVCKKGLHLYVIFFIIKLVICHYKVKLFFELSL